MTLLVRPSFRLAAFMVILDDAHSAQMRRAGFVRVRDMLVIVLRIAESKRCSFWRSRRAGGDAIAATGWLSCELAAITSRRLTCEVLDRLMADRVLL